MITYHPLSPVARVFIVVNLVASVACCTFGWAFAPYERNFKDDLMVEKVARIIDVAARERTIAEQQFRIDALKKDLASKQSEIQTKTRDVATLDTDIKNHMNDREDERHKFEDQKVELTRVRRDIERETENHEFQVAKREELQEELRRAKLDKVAADDAVIAWAARKEILERDFRDVETALHKARKVVRERNVIIALLMDAGIPIRELITGLTGPALYARVMAAKGEQNVYVLSLGSDDGVKPGYKFIAYRGGTYLAEIVVDQVFPDHCAGRIVENTQKGEVVKGDEAATAPNSGKIPDEGLP